MCSAQACNSSSIVSLLKSPLAALLAALLSFVTIFITIISLLIFQSLLFPVSSAADLLVVLNCCVYV